MAETARLLHSPLTCCQALLALVISALYHKPPVTPPAHTFLPVASVGSQARALVRPPTFPGPRSTQAVTLVPGMAPYTLLSLVFKCFSASISTSGVGLFKAGSMVAIYS